MNVVQFLEISLSKLNHFLLSTVIAIAHCYVIEVAMR